MMKYYINYDKQVLNIKIRIQQSTQYLDKLDKISYLQVERSTILDPLIKSVMFSNYQEIDYEIKISTKLKIDRILIGFNYDGMLYSSNFNVTQKEVVQYQEQYGISYFNYDVRREDWFKNSLLQSLPISVNLQYNQKGRIIDQQNYGLICQHSLSDQQGQGDEKIDCRVLCNIYSTNNYGQFINNLDESTQYFFMLETQNLSVIYHSQYDQTVHVQGNLQAKEEINLDNSVLNKYSEQSSEKLKQILQDQVRKDQLSVEKDKINLVSFNDNSHQFVYQFSDGGNDYIVIITSVLVVGKHLDSISLNNSLFSVYKSSLFVHVLLKNSMQSKIENQMKATTDYLFYNTLIVSIFLVLTFIILIIYSSRLSSQFDIPIHHLTKVLKRLFKVLNQVKNSKIVDDEIFQLIGGESNENLYFLSKDTEQLYLSFKNLFRTLNTTNQKLLELTQAHQSKALIKLINQISYFEQFGNRSALGVCHNNIGCIHVSQGRYTEALQHFSFAIIQAQYELDFYKEKSNDNESQTYFATTQSPSIRRTIIKQGSYHENLSKQRRLIKKKQNSFLARQQFNTQQEFINDNEKQELQYLYQKLFNRKYNYVNTLIYLIRSQSPTKNTLNSLLCYKGHIQNGLDSSFWNEVDELLIELLIIENYLQKSDSRTLQINLSRAQVKLEQNKYNESKQIISQCKALFLEIRKQTILQAAATNSGLGGGEAPLSQTEKSPTPQPELQTVGMININKINDCHKKLLYPQTPKSRRIGGRGQENQGRSSLVFQDFTVQSKSFQVSPKNLLKKGNTKQQILSRGGSYDRREMDLLVNKSKNYLAVRDSSSSSFTQLNETRRLSRRFSNFLQIDQNNNINNYNTSKTFSKISEVTYFIF